MATINMQTMRYINLLDRVTRVKTKRCFYYNGTVIFAVPFGFVNRAVGAGGKNIKHMQRVIGRRVKVVREPESETDAERFLKDVVDPMEFKSIEIKGDFIIISAGSRSRAATLIGRSKIKLEELNKIVKDNFGKELKIIY